MKLLNNPEVKRFLVFQSIFSALAVVCAAFFGIFYAGFVFVICIINAAMFLLFTKQRYDNLSELSYQLDKLLHGSYLMDFIPDKEGELALLTSEIYKMTFRLREQADILKKDKTYMSDSLADISHQLKTPLTSIRMIIPRLQREEVEVNERQEYVREVMVLLSKTEWLITSLLKIARLESGMVDFKKDKVLVEKLIQKSLEPLEIMMELKEITLDILIQEDIGYLGDFLWSAEAVGNIIKDCIEHTPEKGSIQIRAKENPIYTEIMIADSGLGIAPEDLPHLFERFYKGKDSVKESAGIGLALSRMIINRQNGMVKAKNRPEGGAQFLIRFYKGTHAGRK